MSLFPIAREAIRRTQVLEQTGANRGHVTVTETPLTFYGTCQPMDGKASQMLPTGNQDLGKIKVYTGDALLVKEQGTDNAGDVVKYAGRLWEVIWQEPWDNGILPHNAYVAEYRGLI